MNNRKKSKLSAKEILIRNRERKRLQKNETSRKSYGKLYKNKESETKTYSQTINARKKREQREKSKKINERKLKNKMNVRKHRGKKNVELSSMSLVVPEGSNVFKNRMEKARALRKFKEGLPKSPSKRCAVISTYLARRSPRSPTIANLKHSVSPVEMAVVADIQEIIKSTKLKRSKNARSVMNSVTASISGENLANSRGKIKLRKNLGLPARRVAGGQRIRSRILKSESSAWALTQQKTRKDSISEETKKTVYNFWLSDGISHPTGNKSDIKRERLGPNLYTSHMTHVLEKTQTDAYLDFVAKYPEIKIGQRAFEKLRPFFVRPASEKDRNTCCCRYHVEANLVFKACMKFRKSCDRETDSQESDYPVFEKMSDLIHITLCPKVNGFYRKNCLDRKCSLCGVGNFKLSPNESQSSSTVEWQKYEYITEKSKGKNVRRRLTLIKKKTSVNEMFLNLKKLLETFPAHQHRSNWQSNQLKSLVQNLPVNHCICIHDYSENYRCVEKEEIQSNYFQRTECSIHVTVMHRHAILEYDGVDSTEEFPEIITEHFFVISPDLQHDNDFTKYVQKKVKEYLDSISYTVDHMHEFTDGCSSQYKSRHCLGSLSTAIPDFGYKTFHRNFFETSHAKGHQDAAGGFIKRQADISVLRGNTVIQNAKDLFTFCESSLKKPRSALFKRRVFRYVDSIDRHNSKIFKPIQQNRQIHHVFTSTCNEIIVSDLSCYTCDQCILGNYLNCLNVENTGVKKTIKPREITQTSNEEEVAQDTDILSEDISDLVSINSVVAVKTDDDNFDYYLMKISKGSHVLNSAESDSWGATYPPGFEVFRGHYYDKISDNDPLKYKLLKTKTALVPTKSLLYILADVDASYRITISEDTHLDILSVLDNLD
ncbi:uncharacterized protein [Mytilus edulis]|uniref:uncharacterized protein n=1 Tax=Mytilus edulis TaxID=6550 RepID=UPI0039EF8DEF